MLFAAEGKAGFDEGWEAYKNGDYESAYAEWRPLAEHGDKVAQHYLGGLYYQGKGVSQSDEKAAYWTLKAANQGYAYSQLQMGGLYLAGRGVEKDEKKAFEWTRKAAMQGYPKAILELGKYHHDGIGVEQDRDEAFYWLLEASKRGETEANHLIGFMFESGYEHGAESSASNARSFYIMAALAGYAPAQYRLGRLYFKGDKIEQDFHEAAKWLEKAAAQEYEPAKPLLKRVYREGLLPQLEEEKEG